MEKYLQPKYIFAIIFGLLVVYVINTNVDLLFKSRLHESGQSTPVQQDAPQKQGAIDTH